MSASATLAPSRRVRQHGDAQEAAPRLRVVHGGTATQTQVRTRRLTGLHVVCVAVAGVLALLFVLAVMQTAIAQGQAHLDDLGAQTSDAQAEAQALRLTVAQLESPERIISEAENRLGMVEPETISYVAPADPTQAVVPNPTPPAPTPAEDAAAEDAAAEDATADGATTATTVPTEAEVPAP